MKKIILLLIALDFIVMNPVAQAQTLLYRWAFTNITDTTTNSTPTIPDNIPAGTGDLVLTNVAGNALTTIGADGINPMLYFTNGGVGPSLFSTNPAVTNLAAGALVANGQGYSGGNTAIAIATNLDLGSQFQLTMTFWVQFGAAVGASGQFPRIVQFTQTPAFDIGGKGSGNHSDVGASINGFLNGDYNLEQNGIASASSAQQSTESFTNLPAGDPDFPSGFVCDGQTWYFEAITYDGTETASNFTTWIGTLSNSVVPVTLAAPYSSINFTTNATVMIGGNDVAGSPRGLAGGAIADVRFYTGVLSQSNVDNVRQFLPIVSTNQAGVPKIASQPGSGNTFVGGSRTFSVAATGSPNNFVYQWKTNNTPVPGATNATLTVTNVQLAQSGVSYTVTVTNLVGPTNSAPAILTVLPPASQGAYAAAIYSNNPAFFWLVNEASNSAPVTVFDYANGNDGVAADPANMVFTNGIAGPSYPGFLGNNTAIEEIIRFGIPSRLNMGNPGIFTNSGMTLTGWLLTPATGAGGNDGVIFDRVSDTAGAFGMEFTGATTLPDGDLGTGLTYQWGGAAAANFSSPLGVPTNEWTFVALVVSTNLTTNDLEDSITVDTNATLYVGAHSLGLQSATDSTAVSGDAIPSGVSANIMALGRDTIAFSENGQFGAGTTALFNDVAVFYTALSPQAITNLYVTGAGVSLSGVPDVNNPGNLLLTYPLGVLYSSTNNVNGPYQLVPGANSPFDAPINSTGSVFYRVGLH